MDGVAAGQALQLRRWTTQFLLWSTIRSCVACVMSTTTYQITVFTGDHNNCGPGEIVLAEITSTTDEIPWDALNYETQKAAARRPELFVPRFVDGFAFPKLTVYKLGKKHIPVTRMP